MPDFSVGVKAFIVNDKHQVLLIKRNKNNTKANFWDIPGGRMNFRESIREALAREIFEETGMRLQVVGRVLSVSTFLNYVNRENQVVRIIFVCKASGRIKVSDEHTQAAWIEIRDYKKYFYPDEVYSEIFENYLKIANEEISESLGEGMLADTLIYLKNN